MSSAIDETRRTWWQRIIADKWLFWLVALVLGGADLVTKDWAQERFGITDLDETNLEASIEGRLAEYRAAHSEEIEYWPGLLHFRWAENKGAAFSLFSGKWYFLLPLGFLTLGLLLGFVYRLPRNAWFSLILLGAITGGAVGNLYDRVVFRAVDLRQTIDGEDNPGFREPIPAVRDFMYWPFDIPVYSTWGLEEDAIDSGRTRKWPIFNIADIGVTGGVIGLVLLSLFGGSGLEAAYGASEDKSSAKPSTSTG